MNWKDSPPSRDRLEELGILRGARFVEFKQGHPWFTGNATKRLVRPNRFLEFMVILHS
jgi:hypothetical protein